MSNITTCEGQECARKDQCVRHTAAETHEVTRLCYSGYSFFKPVIVRKIEEDSVA